ncbi:hypothetical protein JCM10212_004180 [Sporobolomyces blumeae]
MPSKDYRLEAETLVQCDKAAITWSGGQGDRKVLKAYVKGANYFFETLTSEPLTGSLGTDDLVWTATPAQLVQPGTTDACLRQNEGQEAPKHMESLAASLSTASPQLFTGYTSTASSASSTLTSSPELTSTAPTSSATTSSDRSASPSSLNVAALVGGIAGGIGASLVLALVLYLCYRRRRTRSNSTGSGTEAGKTHDGPGREAEKMSAGGGAGVGMIETWRNRVMPGSRPPSAWSRRTTTRRSRAFSFSSTPTPLPLPSILTNGEQPASPAGGGGRSASSGTVGGGWTGWMRPSPGPRRGLPELGESDDHKLSTIYVRAVDVTPTMSYTTPLLRSTSPLGMVPDHQFGGGGGVVPPVRPPTRLTTPGAATTHGGDDGDVGSEHAEVPYQSYSRPP